METEVKKVQPIKYKYVIDELGRTVNAMDLTHESKAAHKYFIRGINEQGQQDTEEVIAVLSEKKQKHFRRHTEKTAKGTKRINVNQREFAEHLIHKLAKQLFESRRIDRLFIPEDILQLDRARISSNNTSVISIASCETEKRLTAPSGNYIIADIECLTVNGKRVIVEIAATHKCTDKKTKTLKELGIDTVEIDISDMVSDKPLTGDIEEELIRRISMTGAHTRWINSKKKDSLANFFDNIILFKLEKTKYNFERDGSWYIWAGSRIEEIPNCKYKDSLDALARDGKRKMLTQTNCVGCTRMMYDTWDGQYGVMACNQSTMSNIEVMQHLVEMSGKMIK